MALVERGTVTDWARLVDEVFSDPWGPVARQVEEYLSYERPYGVAPLLDRAIARARDGAVERERAAVAAEVDDLVRRSGRSLTELAERLGTSRSRLSTYRLGDSGGDVPRAATGSGGAAGGARLIPSCVRPSRDDGPRRVEEGGGLSYLDMARSHVKELAREAFDLTEVVVDTDDDLPFPFGTALLYVSVVADGRLVRVWSRAVDGLAVTKPVLREVNDANAWLVLARTWVHGDALMVEGCLPVETLRVEDLRALVSEVGRTGDQLGAMLATVHGGQVMLPVGPATGSAADE